MSNSASESATFFSPLFYSAASILESRAGKQYFFNDDCRFENMNASLIHQNLRELFIYSAKQTGIQGGNMSNEFLANLSVYFRDIADNLNKSFALKLPASTRKKRFNSSNVQPYCFDFSETVLSQAWYENYPDSQHNSEMPDGFSYALFALQSLAKLFFSKKTLIFGTGNKKYDLFISNLRAEYVSGTEHQFLHDLLTHDVLSLRAMPTPIIRFNSTCLSTWIVDHVTPDPSFVYVDLKSGRVHGESRVMFSKQLAA